MKRTILTLVCAVCLFGCGFAAWSAPIGLATPKVNGYQPRVYIDPITRITHMTYYEDKGGVHSWIYAKMTPEKTITKKIFATSQSTFVLDMTCVPEIIGEGDGKTIYIVYHWMKKSNPSLFHYDTHVFKSVDSGNTWNEEIVNGRDNVEMGGRLNLVFVKETKQLFMTYCTGKYVTLYSRDSTGKYSAEIKTGYTTYPYHHDLGYTWDSNAKKVKLHIIYKDWDRTYNMAYTSSLDEGKNWKTPKILISSVTEISETQLRYGNALTADSLFVGYITGSIAYLILSSDDGNTWSKPLPAHMLATDYMKFKLCKSAKNQMPKLHMLSVLKNEKGSYAYGTINIQYFRYNSEETPFKGLEHNGDIALDCTVVNDEKVVAEAMISTLDRDNGFAVALSVNDGGIKTDGTMITNAE